MSIYVDPMRRVQTSPKWRWPSACHMTADTVDELHRMAEDIGMRRSWFQNGRHPHYDLTTSRRKSAVALGAVEVTQRQLAGYARLLGNDKFPPKPQKKY